MSFDEPRDPGFQPGDLEEMHESVLHRIPVPGIPPELSSSEFLDKIFERAADASARELDPQVTQSLAEPLEAPPEVASPVDTFADFASAMSPSALQQIAPVAAPTWIRSRVRNDLVEWTQSRRRSRTRRRAGAIIAAAALFILALPIARSFGLGGSGYNSDDDSAPGTTNTTRNDIVIVRHRVNRPLDPGASLAAIVGSIDMGGHRGR